MKKAKIFISFIVIAIIPILLYFMSIKFFYKSLAIKNGNHIVNSIEKYRIEKGHLPDSFNDICQKQKIGIKFDEVAFLIAAM